jgi:hypothetical protein
LSLSRIAKVAPRPALRAGAFACLIALSLWGCPQAPRKEPMPAPSRSLTDVLATHTPQLMAIPGVVGTAESRTADGKPCILLMVARLTPELRAKLPLELEGWPVRIEETGEFHAMPDSGR